MTMRPAMIEHALGSVVHGSLQGGLQAVTGCPNIRRVVALRRNCSFAGQNFSSGQLLDPGVWMRVQDTAWSGVLLPNSSQHGAGVPVTPNMLTHRDLDTAPLA